MTTIKSAVGRALASGDLENLPLLQREMSALLRNAHPLPGFNVRTVTTSTLKEECVPVYTTILPAGTLLFRATVDTQSIYHDFLGVPDKGTPEIRFCLPQNYNVFFYPFPFVVNTIGLSWDYTLMNVYVVNQDVEVACYISPTPMCRGDKIMESLPITTCKNAGMGCGLEGRPYDPCFRPQFLKDNPSVVGMIAMAGGDRSPLFDEIRANPSYAQYVNKYYSLYCDSHSLIPAVPEIILYPRATRTGGDIYTTHTEVFGTPAGPKKFAPFHDWVNRQVTPGSGKSQFVYSFVGTYTMDKVNHMPGDLERGLAMGDDETAERFPKAAIRVDKTTGFFVILSHYTGPRENLLAREDRDRMGDAFPELRFTRAYMEADLKLTPEEVSQIDRWGMARMRVGNDTDYSPYSLETTGRNEFKPTSAPPPVGAVPAGPAAAGAGPPVPPPSGGRRYLV